jgi:DNA-binding NtrC family response regulator
VGSVDEQEQGGVVFVLHKRTLAELKSHPFPGNIRELELLVASAAVYALSDAMQAAEKGRTAPANAARSIPLPAKLIRELIQASWVEQKPASRTPKPGPGPGMWVKLTAQDRLHSVTRDMERQVLLTLFQETGGDFRAMASQLLTGDPSINERRVRLRFNQLGLRARELRGKSS